MEIHSSVRSLPLAVVAAFLYATALPALDFNTPGETVATGVSGTTTITIGYGPNSQPATLTGDSTGAAGDVLTITSPQGGTLNLRGDNTNFLGSVNLASGVINLSSSANLFGTMSAFRFNGPAFDAEARRLEVAAGAAVAIDGAGGAAQRMTLLANTGGTFRLEEGASLTFQNSRINAGGGAMYVNAGSRLAMEAAEGARYYFTNNAATSGAGGALAIQGANFTGSNMTFSGNMSSYGMGGALSSSTIGSNGSSVELANSVFTGNSTINDGGAVSVEASNTGVPNTFRGDNLTFTGNSAASGQGGAFRNGRSTTTLLNSTFTENTGRDGGALFNNHQLDVLETDFVNNRASRHGGAVYSYLTSSATLTVAMTFDRVNFIGNRADTNRGGAIYSQNTILTLRDVDFTGNSAGWQGGAVLAWDSDVDVQVGADSTSTYEGNRDGSGANTAANSYHFSVSGRDSAFTVNVGRSGLLDMKDPMRGAISRNTLDIVKDGPGRWNLGGENRFTAPTGGARFAVTGGMLYLYRDGETANGAALVEAGRINLTGAGSSFEVANAYLGVGGGNAITITDTAASPATGTAQGTITLTNATLGMNLAGLTAGSTALSLKADNITITGGITIDLMSAPGSGQYVLVTKENRIGSDFSADQVQLTVRGNTLSEITRGAASDLDLTVTADQILLESGFVNTVVSWNGSPGQQAWNVTAENWTGPAAAPSAFLHGDVVNFVTGESAVAIQQNGVVVAGMYVSGPGDFTFTGGPIIADGTSSTLEGSAVSGKLVLGGAATENPAGQADETGAAYTGTVDFTGITGANEFRGGVDIAGGTLVIANAGQLGTGLANLNFIASAQSKILRGAGDLSFDGAGGENQRLVVDTAATIEMTDANSFTVANSSAATDGAAIRVGTGGDLTLAGATGEYVFTANRTAASGGAISNAGTMSIHNGVFRNNQAGGQGGAIHNAGDLTLTGGGSFTGNTANGTGNAIYMDASAGDASLVVDTAAAELMDMRDGISGTAGPGDIAITKTGDGTWRLGGTGEFTGSGGNFAVAGGTLHLYGESEADGVAAGNLSGLSSFTLGSGATLEVGGNNAIVATTTSFAAGSRVVAGNGDGMTSLTITNATLGGAVEFAAGADRILSVDGLLTGGTLNKTGAGELILTQAGHVLDALTVQDGTLGLVVDAADNRAGVTADSVTFDPAAIVNVSGFNGQTYGDRAVLISSASGITGFTEGNYRIGGQTSVDFLTAQVSVFGNDLVAEVNLAWFDPTERASGTFTLDSDEFFLGANLTDQTNPSPNWDGRTLTKRGAGVLVLTGNNSYSGDTIISEGTLAITSVNGTGQNSQTAGQVYIAPGANLQLDIDAAASGTYYKSVTGGGNVIKTGDGRVVLDGTNAYTGLTVVREGTLAAGTLESAGPNRAGQQIYIDAGGTFELATGESGNFYQTLSGTGGLVKSGAGDIVLSADNRNFLGTIAIDNGSLTANHATALGSGTVANNASLFLNYDGVFANSLTGTGTATANGNLTFSGDHSAFTGETIVAAGSLHLTDGFVSGSSYTVQSRTALTGCATVGGLTVQGGGVLSPGMNLEQFRVTGDAVFEEGSTYVVTIAGGSNASDTLHVAGNTTIESGARLNIFLADSEAYGPVGGDREYLIVDSGSFTDTTVFDFGLRNRIGYDLDQELRTGGLYLVATSRLPDLGGLTGGAGTPNAIRVGEALDRLIASGSAAGLGGLLDTILNLPADASVAADALAQLHGEVFAAGQDASIRMHRGFVNAAGAARARTADALAACRPGVSVQTPYTLWATATNAWFDRNGKGGYSGFDLESHGIAIGMDRNLTQNLFAGVAFGYDSASQNFDSIRSRADYDVFHAMVYGGYHTDAWRVDGYLGYGKTWHETRRDIRIGEPGMAFAASAEANYNDNLFAVGVDVGRNVAVCPVVVTPSVGLHYAHLRTPSIAERDGGSANLRGNGGSADVLRIPVGATASWEHAVDDIRIRPQVRAFYLAEVADGDAASTTRFAAAPGYDFKAKSGKWGRHAGRFGAGVEASVRDRVSLRLDYDFEVGSRVKAHELLFNIAVRW